MADLARRKKEEAIRLKSKLEPNIIIINRLQAILLWLDTAGQVQFVALCVAAHIVIGLGAHLAEGVTLPAMVPIGLGLYLLVRYALVAAPSIWESALSVGAQQARLPYTLDDIVQAVVSAQHFVLTVHYEMQRLRDINYAKYTAQISVICFVAGIILNRVSGYTFVYVTVFTILLLPGIYTHDLVGKLWALANSHPQVGQALNVAKQHYTNFAGNLGFHPSAQTPATHQPAATVQQPQTTSSTSATKPTVNVGSSVVNVSVNASKPSETTAVPSKQGASSTTSDTDDDFVQILPPGDKKRD